MDFTTLQNVSPVYPMYIKQYKDTLLDPNSDVQTKMNSVVQSLNQLSQNENDLVNNWNKVMQWAMNDGLDAAVSTQMTALENSGYFNSLLTSLFNSELGTETLATSSQDIKGAINEVKGVADSNTSALAEMAIQLNHYAKGDGTDETTAIRQAFSDAMTQRRPINLGTATNTFAMTQSIVIDHPLTIIANGVNSTFEQLSWGVPCLEIRSPDVTIVGHFKMVNNQPRTTITTLNPLNNSMVQSELSAYGREACAGVYAQNTYDRLKIDMLEGYGFVSVLHLGTTATTLSSYPANINIGTVYGNTVDWVVLGNGFQNMSIDSLKGINITQTQANPEHIIYITQRTTNSNGLYIGSIFATGIQTQSSHIASIKSVDNFHIGLIHGENCGTALNTIQSSGYVENIVNDGSSNGNSIANDVFIQTSGEVVINHMNITSMATYQDSSNVGYAVMVSGGASAKINNAEITMVSTTPSYTFYTSGAGIIEVHRPSITYKNTQTYAAFYVNTTGNTIINDPELIGGSLLVFKYTGMIYELRLDPNKIRNGIADATVSTTDGVFNTIFTAFQKTPFTLASSQTQPTLRSCNAMKTNNTGAITITLFKYGTNGQEFYVIAGDTFTTIQNNANIVLKGGANLTLTNGQVTKFVWWNNVAYQMM